VPKQYLSKARSLDHQLHGTARGTVRPIEARLLEYGALDRPDAHAIMGLNLGAFGELSTSCCSLCTSIARVAAARLLSFWKMIPEQAPAFSKQKILRFWVLTGQRGWARLILGRLYDLVLSPYDSKGSTLDPGTVAHEHHKFILSRQRARCCQCCRLRLAQRRLKFLCVYVLCYLLNPPLGAREIIISALSFYVQWPKSKSQFGVFYQNLTFSAESEAQTWCVLRA
jgi:hypothetical protein